VNRFPFSGNVKRHTCKVGLPLAEQPNIGHNRWHPDIPPIDELYPGEEVIVEMPGYDDYQLKNTDDVRDVETLDLTRAHPIAGPIAVKGAEPGDLLVVDVLEVESLSGIGYSAIIPGIGGILKDKFPHAFKRRKSISSRVKISRSGTYAPV
jgi:formamidase